MKAILVIDMPNRCGECPLCSKDENCWGDIVSAECQMQYKGYVALNEKPYWCPLKPLPIKNKYKHDSMATIDYENDITLADYQNFGWNACLDEITGETE